MAALGFWNVYMYKVVQEKLIDEEVLWKYMDLPKYLSLLTSESIWLARSNTFKDKREGVFHSAMKDDLEKIYEMLSKRDDFPSTAPVKNAMDFQEYLSNNTYISCWHKSLKENMVMWEIYGQTENSIAIKTTASNLKSSFDLNELMKFAIEVALDEVSYIDSESAHLEKNYRQPFFIKREHFAFEKEVRLYLRTTNIGSLPDTPYGYNIPINLDLLIDEIYVHPDADDWFLEAVRALTDRFGLKKEVNKGLCGNKT
jgi:hypothetical protein